MKGRGEFSAALALAGVALGMDFVSGRVLAAFYAQMGRTSWLGIGVSALLFGGMLGFIARLAQRSGARSMLEALRRMPGGSMGRLAEIAYICMLGGGIYRAVASAAHMGEMSLPLRNASVYAAALCLTAALCIALRGARTLCHAGALFCGCAFVYAALLLFFGKTPDDALMQWAVDLRLENNLTAALLFALLHAAVNLCLSMGPAVRMMNGRMRAGWLGIYAACAYFVLLALGNAVLRVRADEVLALKLPFVALSCLWGTAGFYASTLLIFFAATVHAAGLIYAILPQQKNPIFIEK